MIDEQAATLDLCGRVVRLVNRVLGPAAIAGQFPLDQRLSDLGVTSLKMVNLMLAVELEFGVAIPQGKITPDTFYSVGTIASLLDGLLPASGR